jgi:hypothetical protein
MPDFKLAKLVLMRRSRRSEHAERKHEAKGKGGQAATGEGGACENVRTGHWIFSETDAQLMARKIA